MHDFKETKRKQFPLYLVLITTLLYLTSDIYLPDILVVQKEMSLTNTEALITISSWFAGIIVFTPFAGFISIAFGRRNCIVIATIFFVLLSLSILFVSNPFPFIIFRFLQGVLTSLVLIPGYAAIHDSFSDVESIKIITWMNSIIVMSPLLGPLLGGVLLNYIPWKANFIILGALAFLLIYPLYSTIPTTFPTKKISDAIDTKINYSRSNALCALYLIGISCVMSTNIAWIICSPLIFMQEFELTPIQYGLTQILTCLGFILGSITINQLITVYSKEKLLSTGKWILSLTMISTSILVFLPKTLYLLIGISFLITYFFGFTAPVISRIVMSSYRLKKDHAISIINSFLNIGAVGGILCSLFIYHGNYLALIKFEIVVGIFLMVLSIVEKTLISEITKSIK